MKISSASLFTIILSSFNNAHAFAPAPLAKNYVAVRAVDEDSAQALSDYMAKSHVEKLKAIKEIEAKKNSEIDVSKFSFYKSPSPEMFRLCLNHYLFAYSTCCIRHSKPK
jgi:hypothetical protein